MPKQPDRWKPLSVETRRIGQYRTLTSVEGAARHLLEEWPEDGPKARLARKACLDALEGRSTAARARRAFLAAAAEAGYFVREE